MKPTKSAKKWNAARFVLLGSNLHAVVDFVRWRVLLRLNVPFGTFRRKNTTKTFVGWTSDGLSDDAMV